MSDIDQALENIALIVEQSECQDEILVGLIELSYSLLSAMHGAVEADEVMYDIMSNPELIGGQESIH